MVCGGCLGLGLILYLTDNLPFLSSGGASAYKEMTKFIPNDADEVGLINLKKVLADPELGSKFKSDISKDKNDPFLQIGFSIEDIERLVTVTLKPNPIRARKRPDSPCEIRIFRLSKPVDSADLASKLNAKESMFNDQKFYKADKDKAFFVADPNILILSNETGIHAALTASTQTPSEKMKKLLAQADGDIVQIQTNPILDITELDFLLFLLFNEDEEDPKEKNKPQNAKPQSIFANLKIKSNVMNFSYKITYADDSTAQTETDARKTIIESAKKNFPKLKTKLKKLKGDMPNDFNTEDLATIIESARVSCRGSVMTLSYDMPKE